MSIRIDTPNTALEQRRLPLPPSLGSYDGTSEFMDDLSYTTIVEIAEPVARRRGSGHLVRPIRAHD